MLLGNLLRVMFIKIFRKHSDGRERKRSLLQGEIWEQGKGRRWRRWLSWWRR